MLKGHDLRDYLDERFVVEQEDWWMWIPDAPRKSGEVGRLFDVQALVLSI
jgi:hypothetical protein